MSRELELQRRGRGVLWLRLVRPRDGNRLTAGLSGALVGGLEEAEVDDGVTVVVVTAAGRDFCLGVAPGAMSAAAAAIGALGELSKPTVALVQGEARDAGLELAMACDLRIATEGSRLGLTQLRSGMLPACGGTQRLPRLVGRARAMELLLSGRLVGAREALRIGLVTAVVPRKEGAAAARRLAGALACRAPVALRFAKEAVHRALDLPLAAGLHLEHDLYALLQTTSDRAEGIRAFLARRVPRFRGK